MTAPLADAHLHLFRRGFPGAGGRAVLGNDAEVDAYESYRRAHAIAAGLVVGYTADGIDPDNNTYIRSLAATRPWMATLAYVAAEPAPAPDALDGLLADGHSGVAIYVPDARLSAVLAAWPVPAWRVLDDRRAIVSLNARPEAVPELATVAARHAGCRFLLSHLGLPGRHAAVPTPRQAADRLAPLLALASRPNVFVKISGLYAVSEPAHAYPHVSATPFIDLLLDRFGPDRCLWGSDFSPALEFVSFVQATAIGRLDRLATAERDRVMGGNLLELLGRDASRKEMGR